MKILAIHGSPRTKGNSSILLKEFIRGARSAESEILELRSGELNIRPCRGCLKCGLTGKCHIEDDDWPELSRSILDSDAIVFASPIYFHHFPGPLKTILDRFRSFIDVRVTENGLIHTPRDAWAKRFVLLLSLGSPLSDDARPVIELFQFIIEALGPDNRLDVLTATGVQLNNQLKMNEFRLAELYSRMELPEESAIRDHWRNRQLMEKAFHLGSSLGES